MKSLLVSEALSKMATDQTGPTLFIAGACRTTFSIGLKQDIDVSRIPFWFGSFRNANLVALSASGCFEQDKTFGATERRLYHRISTYGPASVLEIPKFVEYYLDRIDRQVHPSHGF